MDTAYDKGLVTRKQVMGEDYVAKALDSATEFTLPIQEHITRAAWGDVWQREGLDRLHPEYERKHQDQSRPAP